MRSADQLYLTHQSLGKTLPGQEGKLKNRLVVLSLVQASHLLVLTILILSVVR